MEFLDIIVSLAALIILEIILGIDNLVFLSILTDKLPPDQRQHARRWGLTFAWVTRLLLLASALWLTHFTQPLFTLFNISFSVRGLFLMLGGLFLMTKATQEIHNEFIETDLTTTINSSNNKPITSKSVIIQVALMDIIFSFDSVLTAVGLTSNWGVMATAITCAILIMIYASEWVGHFIDKHPTLKMLALSFLILIGMVLVADGFSFHIPRGYIYFAMGFSLGVETLNLLKKRRRLRKLNKNR